MAPVLRRAAAGVAVPLAPGLALLAAAPGAVVGAGFLVKSTLFSLPPTLLEKGSEANFEH